MEEYSCFIEFAGQTGEGKLILGDDELCCVMLFGEVAVSYADITSFAITNYQLMIKTEQNTLTLSKLGSGLTPAYSQLYKNYNEKVRKAFFIDENPILETKGEYMYSDESGAATGTADIKLYERCLCILPPDDGGRRIPLCFVCAIEKGNYQHKLTLDTGETYEIMRLGWDTEAFESNLNECMHKIRQNAVSAALLTDPTLTVTQSSQIAKLMPEGVSAPMAALSSIGSSFTHALEEKIAVSRAGETYLHFKDICDQDKIAVGTKSYLAGEDQKDVLWIIASKCTKSGGVAALEMALSEDTAAATFIYRYNGEWEAFWKRLNHAIEAINFRREVISLSNEELSRNENALYNMAVRRTASLQFLRKCFSGRVIHASIESWKKDLDVKFN